MKKMKIWILVSFLLAPWTLAAEKESAKAQTSSIPSPVAVQTPVSIPNGGIRAPLANEEENFYQKAWPVRKNHADQALLLIGVVFLIILTLVIRAIAKSGPRKPPAE